MYDTRATENILLIAFTRRNLTEAGQASRHQVGNYHVFLDNFEKVALPVLDSDTVRVTFLFELINNHLLQIRWHKIMLIPFSPQDVLFIDEIGKMELFSKDFKGKVTEILLGSSKRAFVIGTIPQMHKVPRQHVTLFEKLHADERIKILSVSRENRNRLPEEIAHLL